MPGKRKLTTREHDEIKVALDHLLNTCTKHQVAVAGFLYGDGGASPRTLYNFGNTSQAAEIETYERLVKASESRRATGAVLHLKPSKPS